jgi:tungstate transport system ATP-binding protein
MSADPVFRVRGVHKLYSGGFHLTIDELDIHRGEILALVGPTGSGKTTLLRLLHFLEPPSSGSVEFEGQVHPFPVSLEVRRRITMVFQHPQLLRGTVLDNVLYGARLRGRQDPRLALELLEALGVAALERAPSFPLSGGEMQRVAVARALAIGSPVLLLDEPTANLDPAHVLRIERIIRSRREEAGVTTVIVTHNLPQARRLADRIALLLDGRLIETAEPARFFDRPQDPRTSAFVRGDIVW